MPVSYLYYCAIGVASDFKNHPQKNQIVIQLIHSSQKVTTLSQKLDPNGQDQYMSTFENH